MYTDEDGYAGQMFDLGSGWSFRIDAPSAGKGTHRHIHLWKDGSPMYSQNADGSPHDGLGGTPPKWVREKLRDLNKWDWKEDGPAVKPSFSPLPSLSPRPTLNPTPTPQPNKKKSNSSPTHAHRVDWNAVADAIGTFVVSAVGVAVFCFSGGTVEFGF